MRGFLISLFLVALAFGPVTAARAQTEYPDPIDASNPYAQVLPQAKAAYDQARTAYNDAARHAYESWSAYYVYYRAYYALWNAYTTYSWYLRYYWYYAQATRFAGKVVQEDFIDYLPRPPAPPVAGATVQLRNYYAPGTPVPVRQAPYRFATTEADGRFHFDGLNPGQTYAWSVSKDGYEVKSGTFTTQAGSGELTIRIKRTRGISGVVLARPQYGILPYPEPPGFWDPKPLSGVKCSLYRADVVYIRAPDPDAVVYTDANGAFSFPNANFSKARVVFERTGYHTQTQEILQGEGPRELRVVMEYNGPPVPVANGGISTDDLNRR